MDSGPSKGNEQPAPEVLSERSDTGGTTGDQLAESSVAKDSDAGKKLRRSYRPSHKATFIGLAVVAVILAVNAGAITFVIRSQTKSDTTIPQGQVTISKDVLDKIGVNQGTVGDSGVILTIAPDTQFKGQVTVGNDITIGGKLKLNGQFAANDGNFNQLEAGKASLQQLSVSSDSTFDTVTINKQLSITGTTQLQGAVTVSQLFTINNSANVAGNLSVGNTVSAATVTARSLTTTSTLTISGHVITAGNAPGLAPGISLGSNGTISISGNDAAGTVAFNVGVGMSSGGVIATITFRTPYATTPHVVVTPIGNVGTNFYISRSATGFSISLGGSVAPGGYAFDYIVEQ